MKKIMVPLILILGFTLCWAVSKFSYDLDQQAAQHSDWNIPGQEFLDIIDSVGAVRALPIPVMDSIGLLSVRSLTLDAGGKPRPFLIWIGGGVDTAKGLRLSTFLAIDLSKFDATAVDSVYVGPAFSDSGDVKISVFVAGAK